MPEEPNKSMIKKVMKAITLHPPKGTSLIVRNAFNELLERQLLEYRLGNLNRECKLTVKKRNFKKYKNVFRLGVFEESSVEKSGVQFYILPSWMLDKCKRKKIWKRVVKKKDRKILGNDIMLDEFVEKLLKEALARTYIRVEAKFGDKIPEEFFQFAKTYMNAEFGKRNLARAFGKSVKLSGAEVQINNLENKINTYYWSRDKKECAIEIAGFLVKLEKLGIAINYSSLKTSRFKRLVEAANEVDVVWSAVLIFKKRSEED